MESVPEITDTVKWILAGKLGSQRAKEIHQFGCTAMGECIFGIKLLMIRLIGLTAS